MVPQCCVAATEAAHVVVRHGCDWIACHVICLRMVVSPVARGDILVRAGSRVQSAGAHAVCLAAALVLSSWRLSGGALRSDSGVALVRAPSLAITRVAIILW